MYAVDDIVAWFHESVRTVSGAPYLLDEEQAIAVIDNHKNTLVSARAGAGKTHTLTAKIIYLIAKLGYKPSEIQAFVFNRKAAQEINDRLLGVKVNGVPIIAKTDRPIAVTFHAYALSVVRQINGRGSFGKILLDDEQGSDTARGRSLYIQDIITKLQSEDAGLRQLIYDYFRKESGEIDRDYYESPETYYFTIRNHRSRTLNGESVKSHSEKIIADFFFEHGVEYSYEPEYYPADFVRKGLVNSDYVQDFRELDVFKADFYLPRQGLVWEHWAIDGNESPAKIKEINELKVIGNYQEYAHNKRQKQVFYTKQWLTDKHHENINWYGKWFNGLVESYRPDYTNRVEFEQIIRRLCHDNGIALCEIPRETLIELAWKKQVKRFTSMLTQFIDRTQQEFYDDISGLEEMIEHEPESTEEEIRIKAFHRIGVRVYKEYVRSLGLRSNSGLSYVNKSNEKKKFGDYGTDFSMLLQTSMTLLKTDQGSATIKQRGELKMILVDEYQDFSRLFYENLVALRNIFPTTHLFCVGDDWQAINRFAGSDDKYFSNFAEHFPEDNHRLSITVNYRSAPIIVNNANLVMNQILHYNETDFARAANLNSGMNGLIQTFNLSRVKAVPPKDATEFDADMQRYIEVVARLIVKHKKDDSILILHRNNKMLFNYSVWGFVRHRVRDYVTTELRAMTKKEFDNKVRLIGEFTDVMTMHKAKGLEAETVILLEVDPGAFPSDNSRSRLFKLFGDNETQAIQDETRLYYVALTRAKKNLYVLWGTHRKTGQKDKPTYIEALDKYATAVV